MSYGASPYSKPRRIVVASTLAMTVALGVAVPVLAVDGHWRASTAPGPGEFAEPVSPPASQPTTSATTADTTDLSSLRDLNPAMTASASATAPDNVDDAGNPTSYEPEHVLDGDRSTAWRVEGDGQGVTITLSWPDRVRIVSAGLVPGYAKIDPASHKDRFTLNRRIREVRWRFDDGTVVGQRFRDQATMQSRTLEVTASSVTIEIVSTIPGHPDYDYTAISDVVVSGTGEP